MLLLGLGEIFRGLRQQRRDDREARTGLALGAWLGLVCFGRIVAWQHLGWFDYGPHDLLLGLVVGTSLLGASLVGVITLGRASRGVCCRWRFAAWSSTRRPAPRRSLRPSWT